MKIYASKETITKSIEKVFRTLGINPDIMIDLTGEDYKQSLELALAHPDEQVVGFSPKKQSDLWKNSGFRKFMSYSNTRYVHIARIVADTITECTKKKQDNPALRASAEVKYEQDLVSVLQHDYKNFQNHETVIQTARKALGWTGTDDEISKKIMDYQPEPSSTVKQGYFPGVFCDVDGTLLHGSKLNRTLVEKLHEYSIEKPVNIWTGGNAQEAAKRLEEHGVLFPVLSKDQFKGSEVEIVFDDFPQNRFEKDYGITAREFNQVRFRGENPK